MKSPVLWVRGCLVVSLALGCSGCTKNESQLQTVPASSTHLSGAIGSASSSSGVVRVSSVLLSLTAGFVVVYSDSNGVPGRPIGSVALASGLHTDVSVPISDVGLAKNAWVVTHRDGDNDGIFNPANDPAIDDPMSGLVITKQTD